MKNVGGIVEKMKRGEVSTLRHENPYLSEALDLSEVLLLQSELLNRFPSIFEKNYSRVLVEIGCYLGKNVLEFASKNPNLNVLGLDITYKRSVKSARKIKNASLSNAAIAICDARPFLQSVPDSSISGICVFFPDPWPKTKQAKNRLLSPLTLLQISLKLKETGFFWFKTDSEAYYNEVLEGMRISPNVEWVCDPTEHIPLELCESDYITSFEAMFLSKGQKIFRGVFRPIKKEILTHE
jgi:tRNA (guanine-N7-)-methyltransferase